MGALYSATQNIIKTSTNDSYIIRTILFTQKRQMVIGWMVTAVQLRYQQ